MSNPTLGTIACNDCGGSADVAQTKRGKGRYLYTRCASCGPDQRAGAAVQTRLWNHTEWREGMQPTSPPPNVKEASQEPKPQPKTEPDDFDPTTEPQPIAQSATQGGGGKVIKIVGVLSGMALVAFAALRGA